MRIVHAVRGWQSPRCQERATVTLCEESARVGRRWRRCRTEKEEIHGRGIEQEATVRQVAGQDRQEDEGIEGQGQAQQAYGTLYHERQHTATAGGRQAGHRRGMAATILRSRLILNAREM